MELAVAAFVLVVIVLAGIVFSFMRSGGAKTTFDPREDETTERPHWQGPSDEEFDEAFLEGDYESLDRPTLLRELRRPNAVSFLDGMYTDQLVYLLDEDLPLAVVKAIIQRADAIAASILLDLFSADLPDEVIVAIAEEASLHKVEEAWYELEDPRIKALIAEATGLEEYSPPDHTDLFPPALLSEAFCEQIHERLRNHGVTDSLYRGTNTLALLEEIPAHADMMSLVQFLEPVDTKVSGELMLAVSVANSSMGRPQQALDAMNEARSLIMDTVVGARVKMHSRVARAYYGIATCRLDLADISGARRYSELASKTLQKSPLTSLHHAADVLTALTWLWEDEPEKALDVLEGERSSPLTDAPRYVQVRWYLTLAMAHKQADDLDSWRAALAQAESLADDDDVDPILWQLLTAVWDETPVQASKDVIHDAFRRDNFVRTLLYRWPALGLPNNAER